MFIEYVDICVSIQVIFIVLIAMSIAFSYALCIFWYPSSLSDNWVLLLGLYTLDPTMFPSIRPSGFMNDGINDPSVYMHCCG